MLTAIDGIKRNEIGQIGLEKLGTWRGGTFPIHGVFLCPPFPETANMGFVFFVRSKPVAKITTF